MWICDVRQVRNQWALAGLHARHMAEEQQDSEGRQPTVGMRAQRATPPPEWHSSRAERSAAARTPRFTLDNRRLYCLQRAAASVWPERCVCEVLELAAGGPKTPTPAPKARSRARGFLDLGAGPMSKTCHASALRPVCPRPLLEKTCVLLTGFSWDPSISKCVRSVGVCHGSVL